MFVKQWLTVFQKGKRIFLQYPMVPYRYINLRTFQPSNCLGKNIPFSEQHSLNDSTLKSNSVDPETSIDLFYSDEERAAILELLNTASERELANMKMLRGKKSVSIVEYRNRHGPFYDLQSLIKVPNFKYKSTVKVCEGIINPGEPKAKVAEVRSLGKFIKPEIRRDRLEAAESIVSIVYGTHKIAWVHVDRKLTVLDWQQQECFRFMKGAYLASVYLEDIAAVVSKLPEADFYILEKLSLPAQNANLFPVTLHLRTVEAMLCALLDKDCLQAGEHRVLTMGRNAVGKHFELIVGDSRTSGVELVKQFLLESVTSTEPRVFFPRDRVVRYRDKFQTNGANREEEMCDSLLQAIAFYELAVFK